MKVLFVCHQNVGRSQMAKAFYNSLTNSNDADAAGVAVHEPGQTLQKRQETSTSKNFFVLDAMEEEGINMSRATCEQLTEKMAESADIVVSMESKEKTPEWLLKSPKYIFWDVPDPRGQKIDHTREIRDDIKARVMTLING